MVLMLIYNVRICKGIALLDIYFQFKTIGTVYIYKSKLAYK